jgi:hypothetical protein
VSGDRIRTVTRFLDGALHQRFGLPEAMPTGHDPQAVARAGRRVR